ncbi:MAG: diguanylate cyclase [Gudongella sp.]|nr:diguanylate cyclase [Gudongella sp.]
MKLNKKNDHIKVESLSLVDKKQYVHDKIEEGLPQLRIIFLCLVFLYGAFGYLDYLMIDDYMKQFLIIRFIIVIPLFILFLALSFSKIIYRIAQPFITLCLIVGGVGIAYMLIIYPSNFSYYGGLFMVIFSGYFLLRLNTSYALTGNIIILLSYIVGFITINKTIDFDTIMVISFFAGANIIGAVGNFQLEIMGRSRYMQEKEIKSQNKQLEELVLTQHNELLQIEKAFESTSDAMAIFNPNGELIDYNGAFIRMLEASDTTETVFFHKLDDIILDVINGKHWNGEKTFSVDDSLDKTVLIQADSVYENDKIIGAVMTFKDITDRKTAEEQIKYIGSHDHLTGLFNRYWFDEKLRKLDTLDKLPLSLIMADLNGLKLLNDTYGHAIGDEFLKSAAGIFKLVCRKKDIVARWGGDEFVILLPNTSYDEASLIADRILQESSQVQCEGVPVSMTLGVSCKVSEEEDISIMMKLAEDKMYRQKLTDSRSAKSAILNALNKAMQVKSFETEAHSGNMHKFARRLGIRLGLSADELSRLDLVIRLHDIGKINIPAEILGKKGPLTADEWVIMKRHTEIGYRIVQATEEFAHVAQEILSHHEKWDGTGYPQNLKGEEIPYLSRIANVVDSYEVMLNGRPYKKPMSEEEIIAELRRCSGTQFDPNLVEVFLQEISEIGIDI